ncbi:MAG: glycosyltransferase family 4 protein, partial [Candidatus Binatia bacterium]
MRILSVVESFGHGGAETVLTSLVLGLPEHEHRVVHFSGSNRLPCHRPFLDALERGGVRCDDRHWDSLNDRVGRAEALGGFRPDVVFFHWWGNDPWLRWIGPLGDVPLGQRPFFVCVLHHFGIRPAPVYDRYVLVSESQRPQLAPEARRRAVVIPNGVDLGRFPSARTARADGRDMIVGRLSRLADGKIPADWVRTATSFGLRDTRFAIAGDGDLCRRLERDARELNVEERFSFAGYVPRARVPSFLVGLDVFCYQTSTATECHPLALLEALASGTPVVAETRGGIPEIVTHGENGLLASSSDEIGEHLHRLRLEPDLRHRLARRARESARRLSL